MDEFYTDIALPDLPSSENSLTLLAITQELASSKTATPALTDVAMLTNTGPAFGSSTAAQLAAASSSIPNDPDKMDCAEESTLPISSIPNDFVKAFSTLPEIEFGSTLTGAEKSAAPSSNATTADQHVEGKNVAVSVPTSSKNLFNTSSILSNTGLISASITGVPDGDFSSADAIITSGIDDVNGLPTATQTGVASSLHPTNTKEFDNADALITAAQVGAASSSSALNTIDTINAKHVALSTPTAATVSNANHTIISPTTAQPGAASSSNATNTNGSNDVDDVALSVPIDPKDFAKTFGDAPYKTIKKLSLQLKHRNDPFIPLTPEQHKDLKFMLRVLSSIESLTPALEKELHLRQSLEVVMGVHVQCQDERRKWTFPDDCIALALTAYQKYASENWGDNDNLQDVADATVDTTAGAVAANPNLATTTAAQPAPNNSTTHTVRALNGLTLTVVRRPQANHPIYGANGIMRGIIIDTSGKAKSYKIDDQYPTTPYKVFGHNGLVIGQWWPMQICALRDGAHGMRIAGIAGSQTTGVHSIVVSGQYATLDTDHITSLHYSAPQSHANTAPTPVLSAGAKALQTSLHSRRPVRVLRAAGGHPRFSPVVGIRYDGLYEVVAQETRTNAKGGAYLRFRLVRVGGQVAVDLGRPTAGERSEEGSVRAGY